MDWFNQILKISGGITPFFLLLIAYKTGLLKDLMGKKNGNGEMKTLQGYINENVQKEIDQLVKHAEVANREMGEIKILIKGIETKLDILLKK